MFCQLQHVLDLMDQAVQVDSSVSIGEVGWKFGQKIELRAEVLDILAAGERVAELGAGEDGGLVSPGPGHAPHGVAAAPEHQERQPQVPHRRHALAVTSETEVEVAESVPGEAVRPGLEDDHRRLVVSHHTLHNRQKYILIVFIIYSLSQGNIDRVKLARARADLKEVSSSGEEVLSILVEAEGHDPVCEVEGFLDPVSMVDVNIYVENTGEGLQKFIDGLNKQLSLSCFFEYRRDSPRTMSLT